MSEQFRLCPNCGSGDARYAAPGRGHAIECLWPTWKDDDPGLPPTQPPAAPETDESEWREMLAAHHWGDDTAMVGRVAVQCGCGWKDSDAASRAYALRERHDQHRAEVITVAVAEHLRVVEGERDAARAELRAESRRADKAVQRANHYEGQFRTREREPDQRARAESAEAAHRALQAAVEALADEWAEDYPGPTAACNRTPDEWARDLRALLAGGEER